MDSFNLIVTSARVLIAASILLPIIIFLAIWIFGVYVCNSKK